jgi:hypothetical protein
MSDNAQARDGDVHVFRGVTGWLLRVEGSTRRPLKHWTQDQAVRRAREIAKDNRSELLIHGVDGRIRERVTYRAGTRSYSSL